jgi:16S rRNA (cytosine967-C5)-methyltransferase
MTARDQALFDLDAKRLPNWPANLIARNRPRGPVDPRDFALEEQLAVGVVKNLLLLQHLTQHHSKRSLKSIDPLVQKILAIGLYQLRFLTRVPASAAVDEAVEQAKRFGRGRAGGFVNAVLRNATRDPDPDAPPHVALSHPNDLFQRLRKLLGPEDAVVFCEHDQREPPTILRIASTVAEDVAMARITKLAPEVRVLPHERPGLYVIENAKRPLLARLAEEGIGQVQDPTAAGVVPHLDVQPGHTVLDRCAGLGTKTIQIREQVGETGAVHAVDASGQRVERLRHLLAGRRLTNVHAYHGSWLRDLDGRVPAQFDRVLIDAPCSNSGVLSRRPEARYHQSDGALNSLVKLQDDILDDTAGATRAPGLLVYSTCSVWPEENQERVQAFLGRYADFERVEEQSTLPSFDPEPANYHDGGYHAVLRRRG